MVIAGCEKVGATQKEIVSVSGFRVGEKKKRTYLTPRSRSHRGIFFLAVDTRRLTQIVYVLGKRGQKEDALMTFNGILSEVT